MSYKGESALPLPELESTRRLRESVIREGGPGSGPRRKLEKAWNQADKMGDTHSRNRIDDILDDADKHGSFHSGHASDLKDLSNSHFSKADSEPDVRRSRDHSKLATMLSSASRSIGGD